MRGHLYIAILCFFLCTLNACELPQNKGVEDTDGSVSADGGDQIRQWNFLTITDETSMTPADGLPGADIDAIVIHRAGEFLSAGCMEVSLYGEDSLNHGENKHVDPQAATLWVREQSSASGFVSLAGGTLLCELPLPIQTGDEITIWEVANDGADAFSVAVLSDPSGSENASVGSFVSTQTFSTP